MSHPDHLAKFLQGPSSWNAWRLQNPSLIPDLRKASFTIEKGYRSVSDDVSYNLQYSLMQGVDLDGIVLSGADLSGADLSWARLSHAKLDGANLTGANLAGSRFDHTDLKDAIFRRAQLADARLAYAKNLGQGQIDAAIGSPATTLPPDLAMPAQWGQTEQQDFDPNYANSKGDIDPDGPDSLLHIDPKTKTGDIRSTYLRLAKKYHPDVNPGKPEAERIFKEVNEAYRLAVGRRLVEKNARRRTRRAASWAASAAIFLLVLAVPVLAVYWFNFPSAVEPGEPQRLASGTIAEQSLTDPAPLSPDHKLMTASVDMAEPPVTQHADQVEISPEKEEKVETALLVTDSMAAPISSSEADSPSRQGDLTAAMEERDVVDHANVRKDAKTTSAYIGKEEPSSQNSKETVRPQLASLQKPASSDDAKPQPPEREKQARSGAGDLSALNSVIAPSLDKKEAKDARREFNEISAKVDDSQALENAGKAVRKGAVEHEAINQRLARLVEEESVEDDLKAWQIAKDAGTIAAFRAYLAGYPGGQYARRAKERLASLETKILQLKKEAEDWGTAERKATRNALEAYLKTYPDGRHADRAERKLAALNAKAVAEKKEGDLWISAKAKNTAEAYSDYLKAYPDGSHAALARNAIKQIEVRSAAASPPTPPFDLTIEFQAEESQQELPVRRSMRWPSSDEPFVERLPRAK